MELTSLVRVARHLPASRWKNRVGRVAAFAAARVGINPIVDVTLLDGTIMRLDARGRTEGEAVWNGCFDPWTVSVIKACVPNGGHLLDVGANVGLICIPVARYLQSSGGKVTAVEPVAVNAKRVRQSAALNGLDIRVHETALGDTEGEIEIFRDEGLGSSTGNAIMGVAGEGYGEISRVPITLLDTLSERESLDPPDVIKLDIEGAEILFLRGAEATISRCRPLVIGEFNRELMPRFGHTFLDSVTFLDRWDYRVLAFGERGRPEVVVPEIGRGNVVLVASERLDSTIELLTALVPS